MPDFHVQRFICAACLNPAFLKILCAVVRLETKEGPFYYRNISGEEFIFYCGSK